MNTLETIAEIERLLAGLKQALTAGQDGTPTHDTQPIEIVNPEPTTPGNGPVFGAQGIAERGGLVSNGAIKLGLEYVSSGNETLQLIAIWTTEFGSWEPHGGDYDIPQWARDKYLSRMPLTGGDHHMYALVLGNDGAQLSGKRVKFESRDGQSLEKTTNSRGFAEQEVYGSSSFVPERGEHGGWSFAPVGGETLKGFGMPSKRHVSVFGVWKER